MRNNYGLTQRPQLTTSQNRKGTYTFQVREMYDDCNKLENCIKVINTSLNLLVSTKSVIFKKFKITGLGQVWLDIDFSL